MGKSIIIIQDTHTRTFMVDRYRTQLMRDFLKSASETEFHVDNQPKKTTATFFGSGEGRVKMIKVLGKGGHFEHLVTDLIDGLIKSNNTEFVADEKTFASKFYEFIRVSQDLPETLCVTTEHMLIYDECELHFQPGGMLIAHTPKVGAIAAESRFVKMDTDSIDIASTIIPICIDFMNEVHTIQRERYDKFVAEQKKMRSMK